MVIDFQLRVINTIAIRICLICCIFCQTNQTTIYKQKIETLQTQNSFLEEHNKKIQNQLSDNYFQYSFRGEERKEITEEYIDMGVPQIDSEFKTYMSYETITAKSSPQYILQQKAYSGDYGIRMYDGYYLVALGSYYGVEIGTKYRITLSTGYSFYAMLGECKSDKHTDTTNRYVPINKNVVEFIVDMQLLPQSVERMGTLSALENFKGTVSKIEKIKE